MTSPDELLQRLKSARDQALEHDDMGRNRVDPDRVYLAIDADAPWSQVVLAFDAAEAARLVKIGFVFDRPVKVSRPPRTAVDAELDKLQADPDAANKATKIAEMMSKRIKGCAALERLFGQIGAEEGANKADILIAGIPEALVECNCNVDIGELRSLMWRVLATEHDARVYDFAPGVRDETIAFPATATWAEASKKLARPLRGAKLVVQ